VRIAAQDNLTLMQRWSCPNPASAGMSRWIKKEDPDQCGERCSGLASSFPHIMLTGADKYSQRTVAIKEVRSF
jgi:hypothetical protein